MNPEIIAKLQQVHAMLHMFNWALDTGLADADPVDIKRAEVKLDEIFKMLANTRPSECSSSSS